jgi:hypothetical protein
MAQLCVVRHRAELVDAELDCIVDVRSGTLQLLDIRQGRVVELCSV